MLSVLNQFKRIYTDDGRNDKNFNIEEDRLRASLQNLKFATEAVIIASQNLSDILVSKPSSYPLH